jgi:hypothetical protein
VAENMIPRCDLLVFKNLWKKWWVHLQPAERKVKGSEFADLVRDGLDDIDWTKLSKDGSNSFFSIIISLSWWLKAVINNSSDDGELSEVESIMENVLWVLNQIIHSTQPKHIIEEPVEHQMKRSVPSD